MFASANHAIEDASSIVEWDGTEFSCSVLKRIVDHDVVLLKSDHNIVIPPPTFVPDYEGRVAVQASPNREIIITGVYATQGGISQMTSDQQLINLRGYSGAAICDPDGSVVGMLQRQNYNSHLEATGNVFWSLPARQLLELSNTGFSDLHKEPSIFSGIPLQSGDLIVRDQLINDSVKMLLDQRLLTLTSLRGEGGVGKTILASQIVKDPRVWKAFPDSIVWVTVGYRPTLADKAAFLASVLAPSKRDQNHSRSIREYYVRHPKSLIVLDDVWEQRDLKSFLSLIPDHIKIVVTTRGLEIEGALALQVPPFTVSEAQTLLLQGAGLSAEQVDQSTIDALDQIAVRLRWWPLLVDMAAGFFQLSARGEGELEDLCKEFAEDLSSGIERIDHLSTDTTADTFEYMLDRSISALNQKDVQRWADLALLPTDTSFTLPDLEALWDATGAEARSCRARLAQVRLVDFYKGETQVVLHDLIHEYLTNRWNRDGEEIARRRASFISESIRAVAEREPKRILVCWIAHQCTFLGDLRPLLQYLRARNAPKDFAEIYGSPLPLLKMLEVAVDYCLLRLKDGLGGSILELMIAEAQCIASISDMDLPDVLSMVEKTGFPEATALATEIGDRDSCALSLRAISALSAHSSARATWPTLSGSGLFESLERLLYDRKLASAAGHVMGSILSLKSEYQPTSLRLMIPRISALFDRGLDESAFAASISTSVVREGRQLLDRETIAVVMDVLRHMTNRQRASALALQILEFLPMGRAEYVVALAVALDSPGPETGSALALASMRLGDERHLGRAIDHAWEADDSTRARWLIGCALVHFGAEESVARDFILDPGVNQLGESRRFRRQLRNVVRESILCVFFPGLSLSAVTGLGTACFTSLRRDNGEVVRLERLSSLVSTSRLRTSEKLDQNIASVAELTVASNAGLLLDCDAESRELATSLASAAKSRSVVDQLSEILCKQGWFNDKEGMLLVEQICSNRANRFPSSAKRLGEPSGRKSMTDTEICIQYGVPFLWRLNGRSKDGLVEDIPKFWVQVAERRSGLLELVEDFLTSWPGGWPSLEGISAVDCVLACISSLETGQESGNDYLTLLTGPHALEMYNKLKKANAFRVCLEGLAVLSLLGVQEPLTIFSSSESCTSRFGGVARPTISHFRTYLGILLQGQDDFGYLNSPAFKLLTASDMGSSQALLEMRRDLEPLDRYGGVIDFVGRTA